LQNRSENKPVNYEYTQYVSNFDSMTTLTVEIDKERDLPELQAVLTRMGLKFEIEEDDWGDLPEAAIEGIKAGMEDFKAGRVFTHAEAMSQINEKINRHKTHG
jgi:predicted transcriptional regulator